MAMAVISHDTSSSIGTSDKFSAPPPKTAAQALALCSANATASTVNSRPRWAGRSHRAARSSSAAEAQ